MNPKVRLRRVHPLLAAALATAWVSACATSDPVPIRYGEDGCAYCRMMIMDPKFGAEVVTTKGKVFKFDSIECLAAYLEGGYMAAPDVGPTWVTDYAAPETFVSVTGASFVHTDSLGSPMGMGLFAFGSADEAAEFASAHFGRVQSWDEIRRIISEAWVQGR